MKRTYKNIENLQKVSEQLTLENILHCRTYHKKVGYITINDLMTEDLAQSIADLLGGQSKTKEAVKRSLLYHGKSLNHWGLRRILYSKRLKRFTYCAGQDYTYEVKEIRNSIK